MLKRPQYHIQIGFIFLVCIGLIGNLQAHTLHLQETGTTDFNADGQTDFPDFIAFAAAFGTQQTPFDLNQNGQVDFPDFLIFAAAFGQSGATIPNNETTNNDAPFTAQAFQHFASTLNVRWDDDFVYVESDAVPDHQVMVGITAWNQQVVLPQPYQGDNKWQIPLKPTISDTKIYASQTLFRGAIGLAINGVPIFNPIKNDGRTDTNLAGELDEFGGHAGRADDYHYHIAPLFINKIVGETVPIAYALDGYPMYGLNEPDGSPVTNLDDLNGHFDANNKYHYHSTPNYPYVNGGFKGTIELANGEEVANQPRTRAARPSGTGMAAHITDFSQNAEGWYRLTYEANGGTHAIAYFLRPDGGYDFQFIDASGNTTSQTYNSNGTIPVIPSGSVSTPDPTDNTTSSPTTSMGLPDTGQDGDYTTIFGEDSDYAIQTPSYKDNANETVTDQITNLLWQQGEGGEMTWEAATTYCSDLSLGDQSDWRLPTSHELFNILDHSGARPSLNATYFTATDAEYWWASETRVDDPTKAWAANSGGGIGAHPKSETISAGGNKRFNVRCVRGASIDNTNRFAINGDGTVTDSLTGLTWLLNETQTMTWDAALSYAESLSLGNDADWRLPNIKELRSISADTLFNPALDRTAFPQAQSARYWSSTTLANRTERAWYVDFQYGLVTYADKTDALYVRAVRGGVSSKGSATNNPDSQTTPDPIEIPSDSSSFVATELLGRPTDTSITINIVPSKNVDLYFEYGTEINTYPHQTSIVSGKTGTPIETVIDGLNPNTQYHYRTRYRQIGETDFQTREAHTFNTARPPGSTFTFAIQADPHLDDRSSLELYHRSLKNMADYQPDFLIDLGDTFMGDKHSAPLTEVRQSAPDYTTLDHRYLYERGNFGKVAHSIPLFLVNGNHEGESGWSLNGTPNNVAVWATTARKRYYPNPIPNEFYSGDKNEEPFVGLRESYYAWTWGDALFVVLDPYWYTTTKPKQGDTADNWRWTLGEAQYRWLQQTLETSTAQFKFMFGHHLVGGIHTGEGRGGIEMAPYYEWGGKNADGSLGFETKRPGWEKPIHQLMVDNNVTAFFHGHDHVFVKQDLDGIVYQEVPQPSNTNFRNGDKLAVEGGYLSGTIFGSSGNLRVTVSPDAVVVDYVRAYLPKDEVDGRKNGEISYSYRVEKK